MRLPKNVAFYLQGSIILSFLAGSAAPTPLYAVYQAAWHFSPITVTVVFGIYALAVLASLLVFGALSDHVGRRPVLLATTVIQAFTMILFVHADSVATLVTARVVQGIATGAAAGAVGAGMLDLDREKGTSANAIAPMLGTATGALLSALLVQYLPAPTELVYIVLGVIFVLQTIGVFFMEETVTPRPGALASMRPAVHLPARLRPTVLVAVPAIVAAWSLVGFYGSLGPALLRKLTGSTSLALGGLALFVMAASGALTVLPSRARPARQVMLFGTLTLAAGVAITLLAIARSSLVIFFVGAAVAGAGFGTSFQGAIRSVIPNTVR